MTEPSATIPRPPNEAARLAALHRLGIVGTPPEERFDRIVRLTARLFRVPYAYLSLVDDQTQWIKSQEGACTLPSARERSFCGHAILSARMLLVPDALQDPRFMDHPLVTGEPYVRFYAGRPLEVEPNKAGGRADAVRPRLCRPVRTEFRRLQAGHPRGPAPGRHRRHRLTAATRRRGRGMPPGRRLRAAAG